MTRLGRRGAAHRSLVIGLGCFLGSVGLGAGGVPAQAGGPPPPTEPPEYYARVDRAAAGGGALEVEGRVQFARPCSLDLVRLLPRAAKLPRLEAMISTEGQVLHPLEADPERFRALVPRGAPLSWTYELELGRAAGLPQVAGADYLCVWLGGVLLAPHVPEHPDSVAVVQLLLGAGREEVPAYGPWPARGGLFRPASLEDLIDDFLAIGSWRVREHVIAAAACTLQVAVAGTLPVADTTWSEILVRGLASELPHGGRALACVAPSPGDPAVHRARRSWLVLWPPSRSDPPEEPFLAGRRPLEPPLRRTSSH